MILEDKDGDAIEVLKFRDRIEVCIIPAIDNPEGMVHLNADQATEIADELHRIAGLLRTEA